jgi:phosphoribosyl-ATP pyrophosphohydrolase/phosphoribosyl-AMP cyclohydrolase
VVIPSIDLIDGQAVQLRQGKEHVLTEPTPPLELAERFYRYGEVAVIDLDAAMGKGDNLALIRQLCQLGRVRVGGGIRSIERADELLRAGASCLIVGTAATPEFLSKLPANKVMVAIDHVAGEVVDHGWTKSTGEGLMERAERLAPYCSSYLCTFVKDEGGMQGMDLAEVEKLAKALPHPVTVAGGVATTQEVVAISKMGIDVQVGMALYTGALDLAECVVGALDWEKCPLIPTVVQDVAGEVVMLAYSNRESLTRALNDGKGTFYSRSREELWEKGKTSGHTQSLLSCRTDCDRDSLLFTVEQSGRACHLPGYSCFRRLGDTPEFSLHRLFSILKERKEKMPEGSFSAKMFQNREKLRRKIMEEAFEVATFKNRRELVWELADSIYFLSLLAVDEEIEVEAILNELGGREK